jgi:hypothetical protein
MIWGLRLVPLVQFTGSESSSRPEHASDGHVAAVCLTFQRAGIIGRRPFWAT